jgi:ribosomal protein S27E
MKKKTKVIGKFNGKVKMQCPNCEESLIVFRGSNRWCTWFRGECFTCGYEFKLKDFEFDLVQPDSPFFGLIYKYDPDKLTAEKKKEYEKMEQRKKGELEKKYWLERFDPTQKHIRSGAAERRTIEREVLRGD